MGLGGGSEGRAWPRSPTQVSVRPGVPPPDPAGPASQHRSSAFSSDAVPSETAGEARCFLVPHRKLHRLTGRQQDLPLVCQNLGSARDLLFIPPTEDVKPADSCSRRDPSRPNLGCCRQGSLPVCQECILLFEGASLPACWLPWERSAGIPECCFSEPQEEPKEKGTFTKGPFLATPDSLVCRSWTPPCELLLIFNFQRFT